VFARAFQGETEEEIEANIQDGAYKSRQGSVFQQQLDLAADLGLNVVIHQRDAWDDTLEIMRPVYGKVARRIPLFWRFARTGRTKLLVSTISFPSPGL
jgi:TatD DNase family protein